jgi:RNA polymerase sigma-70 factor (ECF subfamily)
MKRRLRNVRLEDDVILAREGDREAFIRLIKLLETNLYRVARAIVKRDVDCANAIQETILKAYQFVSAVREPAYFKS